MYGLGTLINAVAVIVGSLFGLLFKRGLSERVRDGVMKALGLATVFIGVSGTLSEMMTVSNGKVSCNGVLLMCISLALGTLVGETLKIEERLESLGEKIKTLKIFRKSSENFTEGFVSATLVFCVGAMAIVGPMKDALNGDLSVLLTKSMLDFTSSMIFASALGVGVMMAVVPLVIYQGAFTVFAGLVEPYLTSLGDGSVVSDISLVGSVLICGVGINLIFGKKLKVGNMTPALLIPVAYSVMQSIINIIG